jgi:hypothetical protein
MSSTTATLREGRPLRVYPGSFGVDGTLHQAHMLAGSTSILYRPAPPSRNSSSYVSSSLNGNLGAEWQHRQLGRLRSTPWSTAPITTPSTRLVAVKSTESPTNGGPALPAPVVWLHGSSDPVSDDYDAVLVLGGEFPCRGAYLGQDDFNGVLVLGGEFPCWGAYLG